MSQKFLTYGEALLALKQGEILARANWIPPHNFIFLVLGSTFQVNRPPLLGIYPENFTVTYRSHIDMSYSDGTVGPWLPTTDDQLAEDWMVLDSHY